MKAEPFIPSFCKERFVVRNHPLTLPPLSFSFLQMMLASIVSVLALSSSVGATDPVQAPALHVQPLQPSIEFDVIDTSLNTARLEVP